MAELLVHCLNFLFLETGNAGVGEFFVELFQRKEGPCLERLATADKQQQAEIGKQGDVEVVPVVDRAAERQGVLKTVQLFLVECCR